MTRPLPKVQLVDGTFELFRSFHGAPRHVNRYGEEVGAVRGLLHTLLSLLKADDVSHLAVAFDRLPAARASTDTSVGALIRRQAPLALEAVRALGIRLWPMVRHQADDALATGARALEQADDVGQIVICTSDTDLFQCIRGRRVVVLNRITGQLTDEDVFRGRFGIAPSQFADYLALVGSAAKGIPGVPGWGPKTTATILGRYGDIESISLTPEALQDVRGGSRLAAQLAERRQEALLVKRLATLHDDLPLDCRLEALAWQGFDRRKLHTLIDRTEAHDLWPRIERWQR